MIVRRRGVTRSTPPTIHRLLGQPAPHKLQLHSVPGGTRLRAGHGLGLVPLSIRAEEQLKDVDP